MAESRTPSGWASFPTVDPVGPDSRVATDSALLARVRDLGSKLLAPTAATSDEHGVPRSHLDALATIGVLGPVAPAPEQREISELIAGSCGTTWFCWTQHRAPTQWIRESPNAAVRTRWGTALAAGTALAGVAFAHVRRAGIPTVSATRSDDGWIFSGTLDWVTSWSIADIIVVVGETDDGQLVRAAVEPKRRDALLAGLPLDLAAMGGTHTCPVTLNNLFVPDSDVVAIIDKAAWLEADAVATANASPQIFGVTRAAISLLHDTAGHRNQYEALELAGVLAKRLDEIRDEAYDLIDNAAPGESLQRRVELRAAALSLAVSATTGAVTARAGAAMRLSDPAQRLARESLFYLVQAQTPQTREATLRKLRTELPTY